MQPRDDDVLEVRPLAPADWPHFALDGLPCRGRSVSVFWDRDGTRYGRGRGLKLYADGKEIATSEKLGPLSGKLPAVRAAPRPDRVPVNFAVNNDGTYFPRLSVSYTDPRTSPAKLIDGNYWYHRDPPNRWTCQGSPGASDTLVLDLGTARPVHTVKLYFLDDGKGVVPPAVRPRIPGRRNVADDSGPDTHPRPAGGAASQRGAVPRAGDGQAARRAAPRQRGPVRTDGTGGVG